MSCVISCRIQTADFSLEAEYQALQRQDCGAVVLFCGLVRDQFQPDNNQNNQSDPLQALELEHYPGMTERSINTIAEQAAQRFDVRAISIIHRVGILPVAAQIVLVGVAAPHRKDAFLACELLMDYLKNDVPLWKKAHFRQSAAWVAAKVSDKTALQRWEQPNL